MSNLSILQTSALVGLVSLLIPLIIHLIYRSRGKVVWVGNIELIKSVKKRRVTEIKLTQWLLLIIRLLLLTALTLLIAQVFHLSDFSQNSQQQVFLTPSWIKHSSSADIEAVLQKHSDASINLLSSQLNSLNEFAVDDIKAIAVDKEMTHVSADALADYLIQKNFALKNAHVFATNAELEFEEQRHPATHQLNWNIKLLSEQQNEVLNQSLNRLDVLVVYEESRRTDYQYISNALDYLTEQSSSSLRYTSQKLADFKAAEQLMDTDWVIVLGDLTIDQPLENFVEKGGQLFLQSIQDANLLANKGKSEQLDSILNIYNGMNTPIEAYRAVERSIVKNEKTIIGDAKNKPLLGVQTQGKGFVYRFYSRFHPSWNSWVTEPGFATELATILYAKQREEYQTLVDENEVKAAVNSLPNNNASKADNVKNTQQKQNPLYQWLLVLVMLLLLVERVLAESSRQNND